ncbi:BrnT family toxin [Francisella philomiragia]|uniref:BrnT family toxin n=1 Tax=Francisella philomiragia TaxID=28110 RepID=UPI003517EDBB
MLEFEWDNEKNKSNIEKHGLNFEDVDLVFNGSLIVLLDERKDYQENRCLGYGLVKGRLFQVVFTRRVKKIRIISFRKANKREIKKYEVLTNGRFK